MNSVIEQAAASDTQVAERPHWLVELNIAGCRINRWAQKRRHLLGLDRLSFMS